MLLDAVRLAIGTLTALPVPAPGRVDARRAGTAMALAPLIGVLLLVPVAVVVALTHAVGLPTLVQACVAVATLQLGTRGLHLDGLADTADGLSASYDRERALQVMRTGDIGPSGVATVTLVLVLQIACVAVVLGSPEGAVLGALALLSSRGSLMWMCARGVPPARNEGLGATVAQTVSRSAATTATVLLLAVAVVASLVGGMPWWSGCAVVVAALVTTALLTRRCVSRLGGISGDTLGAGVEGALALGLLVAAACL